VYLGESRKGKKVAIKKVRKINRDPTSYYLAKSEAKILQSLQSPLVS
jgi:serine/threonine protein kinase